MKKLFSVLIAVTLVALSAAPALARGGCHGGYTRNDAADRAAADNRAVCAYDDCAGLDAHFYGVAGCLAYGDGYGHFGSLLDSESLGRRTVYDEDTVYGGCAVAGCLYTGFHRHSRHDLGFGGFLRGLCHSTLTQY